MAAYIHTKKDSGVFLVSASYLLEVLYMMFGGNKDHCLLLRFRYIPQEMKQHCWLIVHTQVEK